MIDFTVDIVQEPPQANNSTSYVVDGEPAYIENDFEESKYVSGVFGENINANDTVKNEGSIPNDDCRQRIVSTWMNKSFYHN